MKKISFVIPVFNEERNIKKLVEQLELTLDGLAYEFEYVFVDDGSTDSSLSVIKQVAHERTNVFFLELSRNFGHQYALKAGLDFADGDCVISMDCDLQHPPEVAAKLIKKWEEGFDVVYTKRNEDKNLSWFKRKTSVFFYKLMNSLSDLQLEQGTADFRLMSRVAADAFMEFRESELFIRGLVKWAGFKQVAIEYDPGERFSGKSKYTFKTMFYFALQGITSFSAKPLKLLAYTGMLLFLISLILVPYALLSYFFGYTVQGWTSLIILIIFFSSLQLLMLGIIGLYVSKISLQTKQRPLYFVRNSNYIKYTNAKYERFEKDRTADIRP